MNRAPRFIALGLGMILSIPAYAVDVPRTRPTPDKIGVEEPHRYSLLTQALVGAVGGAAALAGVALLADSYVRYDVLAGGGQGDSCRPCTASEMATPRAEFGLSIGLLAAGGILVITAGALVGVDRKYRREHAGVRLTRVQLTPAGLRF